MDATRKARLSPLFFPTGGGNPNLAESVERELREAEDSLFERVTQRAAHSPE